MLLLQTNILAEINNPRENYITNKTDVYYNDDTWSLDILDSKDYRPENKRGFRYV